MESEMEIFAFPNERIGTRCGFSVHSEHGNQKKKTRSSAIIPVWINFSSLEFQNDFFPVYNILLFKNDRYFSSYFDSGIRIIGARIPIRPYPIPITPELKREAELIWSLKPVMCFGIDVFPGSILWIKTEDNRWLVVNQKTEQVSDAQTYLDSLDADKLKKEIEQKNAIPRQNRYLWDYCKIGPDGKVIEWTKRFYWR
ncbi:MAG: hypothetical protein V8Q44_08230 [Alistipes ihumii]